MIYYSDTIFPKIPSERQPEARKVVCDTLESLEGLWRDLSGRNKGEIWLTMPPRGVESFRSKAKPQIWVKERSLEIIRDRGSVKIPDLYVEIVAIWLKRQHYEARHPLIGDSEKYFELKERSKVIRLLESGDWIDDPSQLPDPVMSLEVEKLNSLIEKIDLGRRTDLKFSSEQDGKLRKLGRRSKRERPEVTDPVLRDYLDKTNEERREMLRLMPWIRQKILDNGIEIMS